MYERLTIDAADNAWTSWAENKIVVAQRRDPVSGWETADVLFDGGVSDVRDVDHAVDSDGNAVVLWRSTQPGVWARRRDAGDLGWDGAVALTDSADLMHGIAVASLGPSGAIAAWGQYGGFFDGVYASIYDAATGSWSDPELLGEPGRPIVVGNSNGNAIVVTQAVSTTARAFDAGTQTWSAAVQLGEPLQAESWADAGIDGSGNAIVLLAAQDTGLVAMRYDAIAETWDDPVQLSEVGTVRSGLAVNAAGHALAIFAGGDAYLTACFDAAILEWSVTPVEFDMPGFSHAGAPQVALNDDGAGALTLTGYEIRIGARVFVMRTQER